MRVFIASGCGIATTQLYRCVHLKQQLEALGHEACVVEWLHDAQIDPSQALGYDLLLLYRLPMSKLLAQVIERARRAGKSVIFDTDDLIFAPEMVAAQRAVSALSEADRRMHEQGVRRYLATLQACDLTVAATPYLAELAAQRGKRAVVHRNALGEDMLAAANSLRLQRLARPRGNRLVIGYGSGTATHDVDFQEVTPALCEVLSRYPGIELWIAGPLTLLPALQSFAGRIRHFPLSDWRAWFKLASHFDIALAPLERDNVFCRAKSEIKVVEAGALGVPTVASHMEPFERVIRHGVNGLLAREPRAWTEALSALIEQPSRRAELGEQALRTVLQHYAPRARTNDLEILLPKLSSAGRSVRVGVARLLRSPYNRTRRALARALAPQPRSLALHWLIPEPRPGAGGDLGIFRIVRHLAELGHRCVVHVIPDEGMRDFTTPQLRSYVRQHFGDTRAYYQIWDGRVEGADCTIATFWPTAETLHALTEGGKRFYLVQDFESSFYREGSEDAERAERTYRHGFHCITLGPWLARLLAERYSAPADAFDFAVDRHVYWPRATPRDALRICFYARPSTPRRGYDLGLRALAIVKARRPDVQIELFGTAVLTPSPPFPHVNHGLLTPEELAELYARCQVGLVLSLTNTSFAPLEMMACRCAVVELDSERSAGVLSHRENAWLARPSARDLAAGIEGLLDDASLRERLVEHGWTRTRDSDWLRSARQVEAILLRSVPLEARGPLPLLRERAARQRELLRQRWTTARAALRPFSRSNRTTLIQIFHTHDGVHREEASVLSSTPQERWNHVQIELPARAGARPLRIDFMRAPDLVDIASVCVRSESRCYFLANSRQALAAIQVKGNAHLVPHTRFLRARITGDDPQLILPRLDVLADDASLRVELKLRVHTV